MSIATKKALKTGEQYFKYQTNQEEFLYFKFLIEIANLYFSYAV